MDLKALLCVWLQLFSLGSLSHSEDGANCSVEITVDKTVDTCDTLSDGRLSKRTCHDLQLVLLSLTRNEVSSDDCVDVLVRQGEYLITEYVSINQNLLLHGEGNVTFAFNFSEKFDPRRTTEPHYVLSFSNADNITLSGLDFIHSPGIITVVSVTNVVVENCSFRYVRKSGKQKWEAGGKCGLT